MQKKIDHILLAKEKSIGSETVLQPLPHKDFRFASPFIVIHHLGPVEFKPNSPQERIPPHPHRGFAPVTFLFDGEGFHKDSQGHTGVIRSGDVQWMFAGSGLLHSEGPTEDFLKRGGTYEFIQLWINVPAANKWDKPFYQQRNKSEMPAIFEQPGVSLRLVSGTLDGKMGPFETYTPIVSAFGNLDEGSHIHMEAVDGYWTLLYILQGSVTVNDTNVERHHLVIFNKAERDIELHATSNVRIIYLSGEPINEPVAAKGNIVMNTPEEIEQAEKDYAEGKFGSLDS